MSEQDDALASTATEPGIWSYEGPRHGRHDVSICIGGMDDGIDDPPVMHSCFATAHGKTEAEAVARAKQIVAALRLIKAREQA